VVSQTTGVVSQSSKRRQKGFARKEVKTNLLNILLLEKLKSKLEVIFRRETWKDWWCDESVRF